jgi:hypothetical protein
MIKFPQYHLLLNSISDNIHYQHFAKHKSFHKGNAAVSVTLSATMGIILSGVGHSLQQMHGTFGAQEFPAGARPLMAPPQVWRC